MKNKLMKRLLVLSTTISIILSNSNPVKAAQCYKNWYLTSNCFNCDDSAYNASQADSCPAKHPRQNGIKLCTSHLSSMLSTASYYKRGFSDYNCLAYALGKNDVQSWTWPSTWGDGPSLSTFKNWISAKGYRYTTNASQATGKNIIYVYVNNNKVVHFARKYTLDGQSVSGAATISKWGACSLYKTTNVNPYNSGSGYGTMQLICYK